MPERPNAIFLENKGSKISNITFWAVNRSTLGQTRTDLDRPGQTGTVSSSISRNFLTQFGWVLKAHHASMGRNEDMQWDAGAIGWCHHGAVLERKLCGEEIIWEGNYLGRKWSGNEIILEGNYLERKLSWKEIIWEGNYLERKLSWKEIILEGNYLGRKLSWREIIWEGKLIINYLGRKAHQILDSQFSNGRRKSLEIMFSFSFSSQSQFQYNIRSQSNEGLSRQLDEVWF